MPKAALFVRTEQTEPERQQDKSDGEREQYGPRLNYKTVQPYQHGAKACEYAEPDNEAEEANAGVFEHEQQVLGKLFQKILHSVISLHNMNATGNISSYTINNMQEKTVMLPAKLIRALPRSPD